MIRRLISVSVLVAVLLSLAPVGPSASESLRQPARSPQNLDQRSWLAGLESYAALGDWLISNLLGRAKRGPEMIMAPPVTAYVNPAPFFLDAPTNLTVTSTWKDGILDVSPAVNESSSVGVGYGGIPRIGFSQIANTPNAEQNRSNTFVTMIGEMFHWAGMIGHLGPEYPDESALPDLSGRGFTNYFTDAAIATAANNLGLAMTVEQYRRTYPEKVAADTKKYGSDFAASTLAHGGISNACSKEKNRLMPEFAKP